MTKNSGKFSHWFLFSFLSSFRFLRDCVDVWLPEALIFAIRTVKDLSYEEAEEEFAKGPAFVPEEIAAKWNLAPQSVGALVDALHVKAH